MVYRCGDTTFDRVIRDVALLLRAALAGETVRVETDSAKLRDGLRQWAVASGMLVVREDEARTVLRGGCVAAFVLDLQLASVANASGPS
jgi:hypothetical protein